MFIYILLVLRHLLRNYLNLFYCIAGIIYGGYLSRLGFILNIIIILLNFIFVLILKNKSYFYQLNFIFHLILLFLVNVFNGFEGIWN